MNGIDKKQMSYLSIPSPFLSKNHPVLFCPIGYMSLQYINETLPRLRKAIIKILRLHPNEKGIIHCHSYKVANFIKQYVHDKRLLFHNSKNRERVLRKHMKIKKPSVLVSPSIQEGVDLKDNASRFQVICKLPFPYLGDMLVKRK